MPKGAHNVEERPGRPIVHITYNNGHYSTTGKNLVTNHLLPVGGGGALIFNVICNLTMSLEVSWKPFKWE